MTNTKQVIERMQSSFPHIYNVYDKSSVLYALISVFGQKYGMRTDTIDRLYAMIGIDSTYDEDLEFRWGSLLGMPRRINESYGEYRGRLKIIYSSLNGGTAKAIKFAIASAANINADIDSINRHVHVYDAWEYPYYVDPKLLGIDEVVDESSLYGSIICTVDLDGVKRAIDYDALNKVINQTKASGVNPYLMFLHNTEELASFPYNMDNMFDVIRYNELIETNSINAIDNDDQIVAYKPIEESASLGDRSWNDFGTNSAILNDNFVTNMYVELDEHSDIIQYTALMGEGILGRAVMNIKI